MAKKQDSGLSCFMIVMKFHGIPITKEQAENLSVLDPGQKIGEVEIIQSAKALKMKAKLCRLKINKLKDVRAPIIAKGKDSEFFIIAKSQEDKFMILHADKPAPEVIAREKLAELWDGTAIIINQKGVLDREAVFSFKWFIPTILKFKKEFIQVLIAVFTIQILGILTPVMTQVVVDKVKFHFHPSLCAKTVSICSLKGQFSKMFVFTAFSRADLLFVCIQYVVKASQIAASPAIVKFHVGGRSITLPSRPME